MESSAQGCNGKQNLKDLFCIQKKPLYCQISNLYLSQCRLLFPWDCACQILYKTLHVIQMLCDSTSHNQPHYKYNVEIKQGNQTSWCAEMFYSYTFSYSSLDGESSSLGLPIMCPSPDVHFPVWIYIELPYMICELIKRVTVHNSCNTQTKSVLRKFSLLFF